MAKLTKTSGIQQPKSDSKDETQLEALSRENASLKVQVEALCADLTHYKLLLEKTATSIIMPLTDEEEIASLQLQGIKNISRERNLTLEEVKIYDLLVKNKRLAQGDVTDITGNKTLKVKSRTELLKIAAKK